jgi:outer membrane protein assembly factor BamB
MLRRWSSGNVRLAPPTQVGARVLFAGERTLGLLDPSATRPLWTTPHQLPEGAVFRPRAAGGIAVCGGLEEIAAWRINDGKLLWRHPARTQNGVPCLHAGRAYYGDGHELSAIDLASGKTLWRFAAVADTQISYAPTAAGDTIFVGPGDGRLYALDTADGRPRWTLDRMAEWQYLRQLHVSGNVLVAGSYKEILYGIDVASGKILWTFNAGNFINSHHVAAGVAYLWSPTGWLYAIDAQTGAMRWRHRTTDYSGSQSNWASLLAELVTRDSHLYAFDLDHVLHVLDTAAGNEIARLALPEPMQPFVLPLAAGKLLFGAENGDLLLTSLPG